MKKIPLMFGQILKTIIIFGNYKTLKYIKTKKYMKPKSKKMNRKPKTKK